MKKKKPRLHFGKSFAFRNWWNGRLNHNSCYGSLSGKNRAFTAWDFIIITLTSSASLHFLPFLHAFALFATTPPSPPAIIHHLLLQRLTQPHILSLPLAFCPLRCCDNPRQSAITDLSLITSLWLNGSSSQADWYCGSWFKAPKKAGLQSYSKPRHETFVSDWDVWWSVKATRLELKSW